ncbi:hypothetical protein ACWDRR_09090 [Kitasatospora sp. NPDC003701]
MSWSDFERPGRGDGDGPWMADAEVEDELRVLLQRATPDLPAPADRMDRIRERADRTRRRRRVAGLGAGLTGGLVAAALAAAPATAPAPSRTVLSPASGGPASVGPSPETPPPHLPPATAGSSPSSSPTVSPTAVPSSFAGAQAVLFPELGRVILDVPRGWSTLILPNGTGYAASQPMSVAPYCPPWLSDCAPLEALNADGVLIAVTLIDDPAHVEKLAGITAAAEDTALDKDCSLRGGTRQLTGHRTVTVAGTTAVVELTACLNRPAARTVELVQRVVDSVRTTGVAAVAAAGSKLG